MAEKIIFLDIDGVLLTGKAHLLPQNQRANQQYADTTSGNSDRHTRLKTYAMACQFDPCAVALVNRLAEVTKAKIVVQSNWRRNIGFAETREKLIEQGIEASHFHEDWMCPIRGFSSQKIHDMYEWMGDHGIDMTKSFVDFGLYQTPYIVIDDEVSWEHNERGFWLRTDFNEGFSIAEYRAACGFLGVSDPKMQSYVVEEDILTTVRPFFCDELQMANWLYKKNLDGYTVPPATLLSRQAAVDANKRGGAFFNTTDDELYKQRVEPVMEALNDMSASNEEGN